MAEEPPTYRASRPDPLSVLWHAFAAPQTLIVLLGLLALTLVLASLVPQIPLSARTDPLPWLAAQPGLTARSGLIHALHLYDLSHSLLLRLVLALLGVALLVRMAGAAELAWRATGGGHWTAASFRLWSGHRPPMRIAFPCSSDDAGVQIRQRLAAGGYRCYPVEDGRVPSLVAGRRVWALWAWPVACAAFLVALVGGILLITWGWQGEAWQPRLSEARAVGRDGTITVRLEGFDLVRKPSGGVVDARTQITWREGETNLGRTSLSAGHPAAVHGWAVRQLGYLPVLSIRGWDEAGHPLVLQEEEAGLGLPSDVEVVFPSPEARPLLFLQQRDQFLVLSFEPSCPGGKPALQIGVTGSDGAGEATLGTLYDSGTVTFAGSRLEIDMSFRPLLRADYLPGAALAAGGLILALVALALAWLARPALAWIAIAPDATGGTQVQVVLPAGMGDPRFPVLAGEMDRHGDGAAGSKRQAASGGPQEDLAHGG